ncbi:carbonic anhydrase family protein [Hymenobacter sp.]|jgi:carbonic anhydrase|uniref:carbonic anhydrase n=1 Tax=Hymenobacter sp. TaxID=1898978 RepID=UPI002EDA7E10
MKTSNALYIGLLALASFAGCSKDHEASTPAAAAWNYENTDWKTLGYADCGDNVQSPVDITTASDVKTMLPDVAYNFTLFPMKIVDNGHTVEVLNTGTNTVTVNGHTYNFVQFHFHHHSEHSVNGQAYPLEMHIVSQDPNTGTLVVLSVLFQESGTDNPFIATVFNNIPAQKAKEVQTQEMLSLRDVLPADQHYYTYIGSLTTPPCTPGVDWVIFRQPVTISTAQLAKFAQLYPANARPTQPLFTRVVLED